MKIHHYNLPGLTLIEPDVFGDNRGFFMEIWNEERFAKKGIPLSFKQDNLSRSSQGVLRGLHYQLPYAQGKFLTVLEGEVYDVAVDIRRGSPTFGQSQGVVLSSENKCQLYVPPGFAHGFVVTSKSALFMYKCTEFYHHECEQSILWNDPELNISWPIENPQLSPKDVNGLLLKDIPKEKLPIYE